MAMRLAVISDIHGNLEAFKETLGDIDRSRIDAVICLGDNVGYGPEPEAVINLVRQRDIPCVMGNHELGVVDPSYLGWFNRLARESLLLSRSLISLGSLEYLRTLKPFLVRHGSLFVHGVPPDSITTYLFELRKFQLLEIFRSVSERLCFVGHTHDLEIVAFDGEQVTVERLHRGIVALEPGRKYIVNAGSVGQPRDGNNNAKYVIWDAEQQILEVRFVPYDIAVTAQKILELDLPAFNAQRLW